jgi:vancomycin aglycone glucosyltransferase
MRVSIVGEVHVLLAPHGTRGDVQPMLALGRALRTRGHDVSFVAPDNSLTWIRSHGFDANGNGIDVEQLLRTTGAAFDSLRWQARHFADVLIPTLFASVSRASAGADLIVGSGVQMAAASVAEARRVPYASAMFCPCVVPSGAAPPPTVRTHTLPPWMNRALWWIGRPMVDWLLRGPVNRERARLGLHDDSTPFQTMLGELVIVAADRELAPLADDVPERVVGTDAWILPNGAPLDEAVQRFLASGSPPVYVGFGSMIAPSADRLVTQTIAAVRSVGARVIVTGGWAALDRLVEQDEDLLAVRDVSHDALLPRVAAVVHHGGAGTTTAAARAGRPQVIVPHILDQFYWGRRVEVLGIGPRALPVQLVTADVLAERVDRAVNDPRMAARAAALGDAMRGRDGVDAAVELLETLV